MREFRILKELS